jgi:hypothetical protein
MDAGPGAQLWARFSKNCNSPYPVVDKQIRRSDSRVADQSQVSISSSHLIQPSPRYTTCDSPTPSVSGYHKVTTTTHFDHP